MSALYLQFMRKMLLGLCIATCPAIFANDGAGHSSQTTSTIQVEDGKALKLELPKPMFVGTPTNLRSANLETAAAAKRKPLLVPPGVELISRGKPVSASDPEPIVGELKQLLDGQKEGDDGSYLEFGPGLQWVQIDLEREYEIYAIAVWHFHQKARVYRDVIVRTSADPDFLTGVNTLFNNDHDNSAGLGIGRNREYIETYEGRVIEAPGVKARYVRLYSAGNSDNELNHYVEVEVFGKLGKKRGAQH